jgi:hypothetical protein
VRVEVIDPSIPARVIKPKVKPVELVPTSKSLVEQEAEKKKQEFEQKANKKRIEEMDALKDTSVEYYNAPLYVTSLRNRAIHE